MGTEPSIKTHLILRRAHSLQAFLVAIVGVDWLWVLDEWLQRGWLVRLNGKGSIWLGLCRSYLGMGPP
jgi:hypothetical protein